jgi:hypothetical protein
LKTKERLVDYYIKAGPLKSFTHMESQYAYQKGRSTEAALHDLVQKIEGSLNQKEFALGVLAAPNCVENWCREIGLSDNGPLHE